MRFRVEHGLIRDTRELAEIPREAPFAEATLERVDFDPSDSTAPEAPGA